MNTTLFQKITGGGPEIGIATASRLLQHALQRKDPNESAGDPDLARQRAINAHTGASVFMPPKVVPHETPTVELELLRKDEATAQAVEVEENEGGLITDEQHCGD